MKPHVNRAVMMLGLAYPIATVPQLYNVWVLQRTSGLSPITYGAGVGMAVLWTFWGALNKQRAVWIVNLVWVGIHSAMFAGLIR